MDKINELQQQISRLEDEIRILNQKIEQIHLQDSPYLSIDQLCVYLPTKPAKQTIYHWTSSRTIPFHKQGKTIYFKRAEIDAWIDAQDEAKRAFEHVAHSQKSLTLPKVSYPWHTAKACSSPA